MIKDASCRYLLPGEVFCTTNPVMVNTVLGSCVTVTMFARRFRLGLISHCMLPGLPDLSCSTDVNYKYADCALLHMHDILSNHNILREEVEVKVFGGSDMFLINNRSSSVGQKNINAVQTILSKLGYKIAAQDTGGQFTRKLYFSTETGIVYVRKISRLLGV